MPNQVLNSVWLILKSFIFDYKITHSSDDHQTKLHFSRGTFGLVPHFSRGTFGLSPHFSRGTFGLSLHFSRGTFGLLLHFSRGTFNLAPHFLTSSLLLH